MAIIDRDSISIEDLETLTGLDPVGERKPSSPEAQRFDLSGPARVLLASLSAAAGAIHLAMVPSHAGEWLPEGLAFAVAGWLQIGLAVVLLSRPSRLALRISCLANVVFLAVWVDSRVFGLPFGPEAGVRQSATFIDVACVALEAALVVVGYELLVRPDLGKRLGQGARVALTIVPVGILALATAAIASPSAANHAHSTAAGGGDIAGADHDHGGPATTAAPGAGGGAHDHGAGGGQEASTPPADDKGLSKVMNGMGEGGGHTHNDSVVTLDAATQQQLDAQLAAMKVFIDKYPTVKDAEAAGYRRQGPFAPALGAHYSEGGGRPHVNTTGKMDEESLKHPMLIYDGIAPDSKLAGFMYNIFSLDTQNPPEGFAGPNDHWHYHTNVCLTFRPDGGVDAPLGADASATKELCDKYGGILIANTGYMVHVWPVPGYESPQGMFSNLNPKITCPNGTYYIVPMEEVGKRANVCKDVPA